MNAIVMREIGGPEVLRWEEVPTPVPGPGHALVRLHAAALNRRDVSLRQRASTRPMLPLIPGSDGAGEIVELGPGCEGWQVGQAVVIYPALHWGSSIHRPVAGFHILGGPDPGTYAEAIVVPVENLFAKPEGLNFNDAAALPVAALTAWRAVAICGQVEPGDRVLLPGIGSGVATFALQFAKLAGAAVYVTSHCDEKLARARSLGADGGANYRSTDWVDVIRQQTHGAGIDVLIDSVGTPTVAAAQPLLRVGGRLVTFGATGGAEVSLDLRWLYSRYISIIGTTLGSPWDFAQVLGLMSSGKVKPVIDRVFPLAEAAAAQKYLESGEQFGKVILEI